MARLVVLLFSLSALAGVGCSSDTDGELRADVATPMDATDTSGDTAPLVDVEPALDTADGGPDTDAECLADDDCSDLVVLAECRVAACVAGSCVAGDAPDGTACDDGDDCTEDDTCTAGTCAGAEVEPCPQGVCGDGTCDLYEGCHDCPDDCGPCTGGPCCVSHDGIGCDDDGCTMDVCGVDPLCCKLAWSDTCALHAATECALCGAVEEDCGDGVCTAVVETCGTCPDDCGECPPEGDCCQVGVGPGCDDDSCEALVCAEDDLCCLLAWDELCVEEADDLCGGCEELPGPCCEAHDGSGCKDETVQVCVCATLPECCGTSWSATCVDEAVATCGLVCEGGDCCQAHELPGCDESSCEDAVCETRPSCCDTEWDAVCADLAGPACAACQAQEAGPCCWPGESSGCEDDTLEACVCAEDPLCCGFQWDATCVETSILACGNSCATADPCGDGVCEGAETCETCPGDCGACPVEGLVCPELVACVEAACADAPTGTYTTCLTDAAVDTCLPQAADQAEGALYEALASCRAPCLTDPPGTDFACVADTCFDEQLACSAGDLSGSGTCTQLSTCQGECDAGDLACDRACYAVGTTTAAQEYLSMILCMYDACWGQEDGCGSAASAPGGACHEEVKTCFKLPF